MTLKIGLRYNRTADGHCTIKGNCIFPS